MLLLWQSCWLCQNGDLALMSAWVIVAGVFFFFAVFILRTSKMIEVLPVQIEVGFGFIWPWSDVLLRGDFLDIFSCIQNLPDRLQWNETTQGFQDGKTWTVFRRFVTLSSKKFYVWGGALKKKKKRLQGVWGEPRHSTGAVKEIISKSNFTVPSVFTVQTVNQLKQVQHL